MNAQQSPQNGWLKFRLRCAVAKLDGWLFYEFPAQRSPRLPDFETGRKDGWRHAAVLLRPGLGEPVKIVQSIEQFKLDSLRAENLSFAAGRKLHAAAERSVWLQRGRIEESRCDAYSR